MSDFLKSASILLISSKPAHRSGIRKLLFDNGADNQKIEVASDFNQAKERLSKGIVHIVVTDDDIGSEGTAIDLIKLLHENNSSNHSRLIVLMAGGGVGEDFRNLFLKSGGDLVIIKPYTSATFITPFNDIIQKKCNLSHDEKMALDVEDALNKNNKTKAMEFIKSMKNPNSSLAQYSLGIVSMHDKDYLKAYTYFLKSVDKKLDVRVLKNLVDSGVKSKKYSELDKYVENWIKKLPLQSESVPDITRVVLYNMKFNLLDDMKVDSTDAKIPIAAGLVIASSVFLDKGDKKKSIEYALKGVEFSSHRPNIILKAIEVLVQAGALAEAKKIVENPGFKNKFEKSPDVLGQILKLVNVS
jgi:DNA-binding NarL/FixJ family response regulator